MRPWDEAVSLLWLIGLTVEVFVAPSMAQNPSRRSNETSSCAAVRVAWGAKGLGPHTVPTLMIAGKHLISNFSGIDIIVCRGASHTDHDLQTQMHVRYKC